MCLVSTDTTASKFPFQVHDDGATTKHLAPSLAHLATVENWSNVGGQRNSRVQLQESELHNVTREALAAGHGNPVDLISQPEKDLPNIDIQTGKQEC